VEPGAATPPAVRRARLAGRVALGLAAAWLLLLVPGSEPSPPSRPAEQAPFAWNRGQFWEALEARFQELRGATCEAREPEAALRARRIATRLAEVARRPVGPEAPEWLDLERELFLLAPVVAGCEPLVERYGRLAASVRDAVKRRSATWDPDAPQSRATLYRLLYGTRLALEEAAMQLPLSARFSALLPGRDEPSAAPAAEVAGVPLRSGDILLSRGDAPTSALIARGSDFPGNFSHVALVHVDPGTREVSIVESLIERGLVVTPVQKYLGGGKLRVLVLRPRADLPVVAADPLLPHRAAEAALRLARQGHTPYDFAMAHLDHSRLFCSEVPFAAYEPLGLRLWAGLSHISAPGLRRWLSRLGVSQFVTQEPSDLEYDPQLVVVAEWRDLPTLRADRLMAAATDAMLERAEGGWDPPLPRLQLPLVRVLRAASAALRAVGLHGPVPEGMTATAALRSRAYSAEHERLVGRLTVAAARFRAEQGYEPPYWELLRLAGARAE
jgi:hypothetical protein